MKLLLDTHTAIWWMNGHEKLPPEVKSMLSENSHSLYISIVSAWEIAIKASLGKLPEFEGGVKAFLATVAAIPVVLLPIMPKHIEMVETLPFHHKDPFDRLLVATALAENLTIITADESIQKYDVPWIW